MTAADPNASGPRPTTAPAAGVDTTLIDIALSMSPEERLEHNDRMASAAKELRAALAAADDDA